ncbi:hypothetical protein QYF61_022241 [Mycteria americana]|uniref:Uncharacterized protein n=1 Tax=Mycteria americana TaxID=33587 RepID=A0AAN7Q7M5_MYCAM|nr:hypothetical protein QYF61_022241 [Mycteria americana]
MKSSWRPINSDVSQGQYCVQYCLTSLLITWTIRPETILRKLTLLGLCSKVLVAEPMEVHDGAVIHLQPMEDPMPEQVDA